MTERPKLMSLDHYRAMDAVPSELIELLEQVLQLAKEGKLVECIITFQIGNGIELNSEGQFMWRNDGRLDAIHSSCHILANRALQAILGE